MENGKMTDVERRIDEGRSHSPLWQFMKADTALDFKERNHLYQRACALVNAAYIFTDIIDWCVRDADELTRRFGVCVKDANKRDYKRLRRYLSDARKMTEGKQRAVSGGGDVEEFVNGNSDYFYDLFRLALDRLDRPEKAERLVGMVRTMPNVNGLFPELDKGEYKIDIQQTT